MDMMKKETQPVTNWKNQNETALVFEMHTGKGSRWKSDRHLHCEQMVDQMEGSAGVGGCHSGVDEIEEG